MDKEKRWYHLDAWQIVTLIIVCLVLVWLSIPTHVWHHTPPERAKVSRARTDMRSMATAIEAYFVDVNRYPAWGISDSGPGGTQTYNFGIGSKQQRGTQVPATLPCFLLKGPGPNQQFCTLTTPLAYITSYVADPFSPTKGATFVYWAIEPGQPDPTGRIVDQETPLGWILISPGPDGDYDIPGSWDAYDPAVSQPSPRLRAGANASGAAFTYDPTNGATSNGDLWRVKQ